MKERNMSTDDKTPEFDEDGSRENTSPASDRSDETPSSATAEQDATAVPFDVDRWTLLRDVVVFQGKLLLDGVRDLILSPISIGAAIIGLLSGGDRPGRQFYDLLYVGKRTEKWINLFGATAHVTPPSFHREESESVDALVERLEEVARRQYEKGGLTKNAKHAVDRALDAVDRGLKQRK